jgi:hypothetical protein
MLPVVAGAAALLVTRVSPWFSVALVCGFVVSELTRLRAAGHLPGSRAILLGRLTDATVGQPFVALAVALAVLGATLLVGALVRLAFNEKGQTTPPLPG